MARAAPAGLGVSAVATRLRPPRPQEEAVLAGWRADPASPYEDFTGGPTPGRYDTGLPTAPPGLGRLAVTDGDDLLLGTVSWHEVTYGPNRGSTALSIGISLRPSARQKGHGARAQGMLAEYLFVSYPVHRLEATTDVTNVAEQRALERAGFRREGVLRGAQWRGGRHDLVMYARLRDDPATDGPPMTARPGVTC